MRHGGLVVTALMAVAVGGSAAQTQTPYTIAFASFAPLNAEIFVAAADGTGATPFVASPAEDWNASFSRDGRWIVFTSTRNGSADLYRAHPDGSALERLTDDPAFDDQGALSPDGRRLAFVSTRGGQADVWTLDLQTRKAARLTHEAGGNFRPAWSPDGAWIAFATGRSAFRDEMALHPHNPQSYGDIAVIKPDGSELQVLTDNPWEDSTPRWAPAPAAGTTTASRRSR